MNPLPLGKVPWNILVKLVENIGFSDNPGVIQAAKQGVDVSVLNLADITDFVNSIYQTDGFPYLIYKSDPITFPTPNPAKYLIAVNKNDLATAGALPFGILITILMPPTCTSDEILNIQNQISQECKRNKITILGGHTEITDSVSIPVLSASMIGFVPPSFYIPRNIIAGDAIICSGLIGAEGTGILFSEGKDVLKQFFTDEEIRKGNEIGELIDISERIIQCNKHLHNSIHLVHDATEGGILGAIYECIAPKGFGCKIDSQKIPISDITKKAASILNIDPLKLISSGSVLIFCSEKDSSAIINFLKQFPVPVAIIGQITEANEPLIIDGEEIQPPESDHVVKGLAALKLFQEEIR